MLTNISFNYENQANMHINYSLYLISLKQNSLMSPFALVDKCNYLNSKTKEGPIFSIQLYNNILILFYTFLIN